MLRELQSLVESLDLEDSGAISLLDMRRDGPAVTMRLDVCPFNDEFERQAWIVHCELALAARIGADSWQGIRLQSEHPLLAAYSDSRAQLAFKGPASDARHAVADLWEQHRAIADGWIAFDEFFNSSMPLAQLLASTSGILADGPRRFIDAYANTLRRHGVDAYITRERAPQRWEDGAWRIAPSNAEVLVLPPDDYVIGVGFSAHPMPIEPTPMSPNER